VINGDIYNFLDLRLQLEERGHNFRSYTDSEVVLHLYEEYGLAFIYKLRGMFALALYDKNRKRLILARDPIGKNLCIITAKAKQ